MLNLSAFIEFHARTQPDRVAIVYGSERVSYRELDERVRILSALLSARGIGPGNAVGAFMRNSPAFLELAIATSRIGGVFLPINFRLSADEVEYIASNAEAGLVLADAEFAEIVASLPNVILLDDAAQRDSRRLARAGLPVPPVATRGPDDLFRLMYTSGTTDRPKGVMHTYGNFYWKCMDQVVALGLTREVRLLVVGPLYHVGAFDLPGVAVLWVGGMLCVHRDFDPESVLESIARERLTGAWMAPVMMGRTLEVNAPERFDLSSFRWCIGGGGKTTGARTPAPPPGFSP